MATGGQFTVETEYFCRYYLLLYDVGTNVLRKLIKLHSGQTLDAFLRSPRIVTIINTLKERKIIQQYQHDVLYPPDGSSTDLSKWDVSLLCTIIKNTCLVSKSVKTSIDKLRQERNQMCHGGYTSINLADYTTKEQTARIFIMTIVRQCNDATYEREVLDTIDKIKTQALEIQPTIDMFQQAVKRDNELQALNEQMNTVVGKVEFIQENVDLVVRKLQDMSTRANKGDPKSKTNRSSDETQYYSVPTSPTQNPSEVQYQQTGVDIVYSRTPFYEHMAFYNEKGYASSLFREQAGIKTRQLRKLLEQESRFVHTKQFQQIEEMLKSAGNVIISGRPGEGKTSAAYELMRTYGQCSKCIEIDSPDDIIFLEPNMFEFVFIDDLFGQHDVDESKVKVWVPVLEKLQNLLRANAFKLIISSREMVLNECKDHIIQFDMFSNKVLISSENLSDEEKMIILQAALKSKARSLTDDEMLTCIGNCRSDIGFPYLCFLFASNEEFFQEKQHFFQRSLVVTDNLLLRLQPLKLLALWYMWVKGYACRKDELFNVSPENMKFLKDIRQQVENRSTDSISKLLNDIKKKLDIMKNIFIVESKEEYKFLHNSIYQSIGLHFAHHGYAPTVLMSSTLDFFMECFRLKSNDVNSVIFLTEELYPTFVQRIIIEVIEKGHCREIVQHPCITEPVLNVLKRTLSTRKLLDTFLCTGVETNMCSPENITFLEGILETAIKESYNFLKKVIKPKCIHIKKTTCKRCSMLYTAYRGACKGGNTLALLKLNFVEIDDKLLVSAVESRSKVIVDRIVKHLGSVCPLETHKALLKSIELGSFEIYLYIRNTLGGVINIDCLHEAVKKQHIKLLDHIAFELTHRGHVYTEIQRRRLFDDVDNVNVYQMLSKYNILPTKENIATYISQKRHQLLKDIVFDLEVKQADLSKVIKATPSLNDYFIFSCVLSPREYITDAILKDNLERVKRVIECHNSIGICDPSKPWVSRAISYFMQHPSVFPFYISMLHKGFIPNDNILYFAVQTNSLDVVQETISKMKINGKFNCKSKTIKRALLVSVHSQDIYNYLVAEGVKPSYYHVLFVAECGKDDADAVAKNVFSILKARDIKPHNKDIMGMALLASLGQLNLYHCIRTEGGIQLPPYALSAAIKRDCIDDLRFVIKEMKLQSVWPPVETDIMNALGSCFYIPDLFQELMTSYDIQHVTVFSILAAVRQKNLEILKQSIGILKKNNSLDVNDVIVKLAVLEATGNNEVHTFLEREGICHMGIFEKSVKSKNAQFICHVMLMLQSNGKIDEFAIDPCSLRLAFETPNILEMILKSPDLCTSKLLLIATENRHPDVVKMIMCCLKERNIFKPDDENLIQAVVASVNYTDMLKYLIEEGVSPSMERIHGFIENGTKENVIEAIRCLFEYELLDFSSPHVDSVLETLLANGYLDLCEQMMVYYNFTPSFRLLEKVVEFGELRSVQFVLDELSKEILSENRDAFGDLMEKSFIYFPIYQLLSKRGMKPNSRCVLKAVELNYKDIVLEVMNDFLSEHKWSCNDLNLQLAVAKSKADPAILDILREPVKEALQSLISTTLQKCDSRELQHVLDTNDIFCGEVISEVLCDVCVDESSVPGDLVDILLNHLDCKSCEFSNGKVLRAVFRKDLHQLTRVIYYFKQNNAWYPNIRTSIRALEVSFYLNQEIVSMCLMSNGVIPNAFCLFYAMQYNMSNIITEILHTWAVGEYEPYSFFKSKEICNDTFLDRALSLCCKQSDVTTFKVMLKCGIRPNTELLYETVISNDKNSKVLATLILDSLEKRNALRKDDSWIIAAIRYYETGEILPTK